MPTSNPLPRMLKYAGSMAATTSVIGVLLIEQSMNGYGPDLMWLTWPLIFAVQLALFRGYLRKDQDAPYATIGVLAALSAALAFAMVFLAFEPAAAGMAIIHFVISLIAGVVMHGVRARSARAVSHAPTSAHGHPPPVTAGLDANALRKLKALHDSGAITDEQFEREKSRVLGH